MNHLILIHDASSKSYDLIDTRTEIRYFEGPVVGTLLQFKTSILINGEIISASGICTTRLLDSMESSALGREIIKNQHPLIHAKYIELGGSW